MVGSRSFVLCFVQESQCCLGGKQRKSFVAGLGLDQNKQNKKEKNNNTKSFTHNLQESTGNHKKLLNVQLYVVMI